MTVLALFEHIAAAHKANPKLMRVTLSADDAAELVAEITAKPKPKRCCCACHLHEPAPPTSGYVMTFVGVEVWRK